MTAIPLEPRRWLTPLSPLTGEAAGRVRVTDPAELPAIIARSRHAFEAWGTLTNKERKPYLRAFAKQVMHSMDRIADVVVAETGKDRGDALAEITAALTALDFYSRKAATLLRPKKGTSWPFVITKGWTEYHPIGVAAVISPWNYPFYLPLLSAIQALSAGCTVIIKPSEVTPLSGAIISDLAIECGIPDDVVQVVHGDGEIGAQLVAADTDIIAFTGSPTVGKQVAVAAAAVLKPVVLELGGKDAQVVLDDANIANAARAAVTFGVFNAGQTCVGIERVYVVDSVYDRFMEEAGKAISQLKVGTRDRNDVGPLISRPQIDTIERHLTDAIEKGAEIVAGGKRLETQHGLYFEPTLVTNVDHSMLLMQTETFGPIVPVMRVADEAEAIEMANDSPYGLHGSVWTGNKRRGQDVASRLDTGTVAINDHLINFFFPSIELAGIGDSGLNGHLGEDGIKNFSIHRSVTSARLGPTTKLLGAWLPRRVGPRYWKVLARLLFGWRR